MSRSPDTRKLFAAAALVSAGGALAAEAVLVHDIAPPHPRYTQLTQMAAEVARRTQGTLTIAINPGGKVLYPATYQRSICVPFFAPMCTAAIHVNIWPLIQTISRLQRTVT